MLGAGDRRVIRMAFERIGVREALEGGESRVGGLRERGAEREKAELAWASFVREKVAGRLGLAPGWEPLVGGMPIERFAGQRRVGLDNGAEDGKAG